jgi:hypothetical protein
MRLQSCNARDRCHSTLSEIWPAMDRAEQLARSGTDQKALRSGDCVPPRAWVKAATKCGRWASKVPSVHEPPAASAVAIWAP